MTVRPHPGSRVRATPEPSPAAKPDVSPADVSELLTRMLDDAQHAAGDEQPACEFERV